MPKRLLLLFSTLFLSACANTASFHRDADEMVTVEIEHARSAEERAIGLMNRQELCSQCGMLFDFNETRHVSMWMKNTLISLDMFYISEDMIVTEIFENTIPHSLEGLKSSQPVRYVLETNAGFAKQHNIQVGDRLVLR
ncbi:DUF192 domain-containing protein [Vibrio mexicanus]|uniref:DUF192 domain-containing protein n=1 Tax=Vibrio mexicanus TaxID=1004326 RepID=UPI00063CD455|nr:DUF192 domain-containing protein [Vibrio mexicanus]